MKRFIVIISMLLLTAAPSLACMWEETHNYYLFSVYNRSEFSQRVDEISRQNWKVYLGKNDGKDKVHPILIEDVQLGMDGFSVLMLQHAESQGYNEQDDT